MREIKFRAWNGKEMFEPSSINWKNGVLWVCDSHGENKLEYELVAPNSQLMQFTGLKDAKGVDIYEGDIVKHCVWGDWEKNKDRRWQEGLEIVWDKEHSGFTFKFSESRYSSFGLLSGYGYEIIGNIYENPKLLEAK